MTEDKLLVLPDGRTLSYTTAPSSVYSNAPTVFYFHGYPGTHAEASLFAEAAFTKGIAIIAITRPGFGNSSFQSNRTLLAWPKDVLAVADHLNIQHFAVMGLSGGGPYVLACMRAIERTRCVSGAVVSGSWPMKLGAEGMMLPNRFVFGLAYYSTKLTEWFLRWAWGLSHPENLERTMAEGFKNLPPEDQAAFEAEDGKLRKVFVKSVSDALRNGTKGAAWEAWLLGSEWGFELEDVEVERGRLVLWHGEKDVHCPARMARKAAEMIGGAELRMCEEETHISLLTKKMADVVESVVGLLKI